MTHAEFAHIETLPTWLLPLLLSATAQYGARVVVRTALGTTPGPVKLLQLMHDAVAVTPTPAMSQNSVPSSKISAKLWAPFTFGTTNGPAPPRAPLTPSRRQ